LDYENRGISKVMFQKAVKTQTEGRWWDISQQEMAQKNKTL